MKRQTGFTLVEIAIVLVVIGLLLGGVLKGQELVLNAQIRNTINEYNNVASATFAYQDRYRQLPGDDTGAVARWAPVTVAGSAANGQIDGEVDYGTGASADEAGLFWQHLRNDSLVVGDATSTNAPPNSFNGITGVQDTVFDNDATVSIIGTAICQSNIPTKPAVIIDTRIDDSLGQSGSLLGAPLAATTLPVEEAAYSATGQRNVLCRQL